MARAGPGGGICQRSAVEKQDVGHGGSGSDPALRPSRRPHACLLKLALLGSEDLMQTLEGVERAALAMAEAMKEVAPCAELEGLMERVGS